MNYCLPQDYKPRLEPDRDGPESDDGFWQPDLYSEAAALAKRLGASRIVGIGCRTGQRLAALHPTFQIVGIDDSANIVTCRQRYAFGTWIEVDFVSDNSLGVEDSTNSVLVGENLLEHITDPDRILTLLSNELERGAAAVLLATPDRELMNGDGHLGPPADPAHLREWTRSELERFMASAGLAGFFGLTRTNQLMPFMRTILVVVPGHRTEQREVVSDWWAERARWQRLVEEQDRAMSQQNAWVRELRTARDWFAQQREAWEAAALEKDEELRDSNQRIAELESVLAEARGGTSIRRALHVARRLAHVGRGTRPSR
jgi:hypothetical protein